MNRLSTWMILLCIQVIVLASCSGCEDRTESSVTNTFPSLVSPTPVVIQTTKPTETDSEEQLQMKKVAAPKLISAETSITETDGMKRIVYRALAGNPYGVKEGTIIGVYKHEVYLGEQRTGGLALAAPVVSHYQKKAIGDLPAGQARWLLTLPVDISDCRSLEPVRIDRSAKPLIDRPYYIRISSSEELGVVNILDERQTVVIDEFKMYGLHYVISQKSNESERVIEGEEMAFLFVIVRFQSRRQSDQGYASGDLLGTTREPVLAGLTSVRGPMLVHEYNCILKIEGCPVFMMANQKR